MATGGVAAASETATGAAGAGTEGITAGAAGASASTAAGGTAAGVAGVGAQSVLNRRLGNVALAGAAVAGALVFALALGGARVPVADVRGETITIGIPNEPSQPGGENPQRNGHRSRRWTPASTETGPAESLAAVARSTRSNRSPPPRSR